MNTPNPNPSPFIPQGSMLEQKNKGRARVKIAVFFVLAMHIVLLVPLLMLGCKREEPPPAVPDTAAPPPLVDSPPPPDLVAPPPATSPYVSLPPVDTGLAATPSFAEHLVTKGETFTSIAKKHGVTIKAIADANPTVDPNKLQIGQKLVIPPPTSTPAAPTTSAPAMDTASGQVIYTVKSGDTLTKIANEYHVTIKELRAANNLTTDRIVVGQKLKIPAKPPAGSSPPTP